MSNSNLVSQIVIGDYVCFKSDIEQSGLVVEIRRDYVRGVSFVLENDQGFIGEYIGGQYRTTVLATDCWNEEGQLTK